jgi:hypothetical protein
MSISGSTRKLREMLPLVYKKWYFSHYNYHNDILLSRIKQIPSSNIVYRRDCTFRAFSSFL